MNPWIERIKRILTALLRSVRWTADEIRCAAQPDAISPEIIQQRRLYFLVLVGFLLIASFIAFLFKEYYLFQELNRSQHRLQRIVDEIDGCNVALRTAARLGAATTETRWEGVHQEKEVEMDSDIQNLVDLYTRYEKSDVAVALQIYNVELLEKENDAFYLVRGGRTDYNEAMRLLDNTDYQQKKDAFEDALRETEKHMVHFLDRKMRSAHNASIMAALALLLLSIIPIFPIIRVLRVIREISREREVAEEQLTRLNSCLLSFGSNSLINIQSLVDLCGALLSADSVAYQRIENGTVCTVAWYGKSICRPAELLPGSLAQGVIDNVYNVPLICDTMENSELARKLGPLTELDCRTFMAQLVKSEDEVIGVLNIFYRNNVRVLPQNLRFITIACSAIAPEEKRAKAVETLRTSEANYRLMADNATDLIMRSTLNGTIVYVSPACSKLLGYTPTELIGVGLDRFWHPEDMPICWEQSAQGYRTLVEGTSVHRLQTKTGDYLWFETISRQVVNNEERWGREMILVSREITERKQAENALQREREQLAVTLGSITDGVISTDLQNRVVLMNRVAEELTGWTLAEAQGKDVKEVFCAPVSCCDLSANGKPNENTSLLHGVTLRSREGKSLSIEGSCAPIHHFDGSVIGYIVVFHDQSEKQRLQAQVALSSKLQSIGQLAAGIAHEINTPMQFIGDNTEFCRNSYKEFLKMMKVHLELEAACVEQGVCVDLVRKVQEIAKEIDSEYLLQEIPKAYEETIAGVARVTKLVQAMKTFSHPSQGRMQISDLNQSIEATVNVTRNEWKYVADLQLDLAPDMPMVPCLIDELNQVVLNMITNSVDSIKDVINAGGAKKGNIYVGTRYQNGEAHIIIKDSGQGMPEDVMRKIFDPFFTTKEPGKGTGQGLAISHDIIVNKHKGRIEVKSDVGQGTQFTIILPVQETVNQETA